MPGVRADFLILEFVGKSILEGDGGNPPVKGDDGVDNRGQIFLKHFRGNISNQFLEIDVFLVLKI